MKKQLKKETRYDEIMTDLNPDVAVPYSMTACFKADDLIDHPKFGLGKVMDFISPNKIQVIFREGEKILIGVLNQEID